MGKNIITLKKLLVMTLLIVSSSQVLAETWYYRAFYHEYGSSDYMSFYGEVAEQTYALLSRGSKVGSCYEGGSRCIRGDNILCKIDSLNNGLGFSCHFNPFFLQPSELPEFVKWDKIKSGEMEFILLDNQIKISLHNWGWKEKNQVITYFINEKGRLKQKL